MQAIILAAGMGKRLKDLTKDNTKCMVKVNGITLIERMLHQIEKQNVSRIIIVIGYQGKKLVDFIESLGIRTPIIFIENQIYDKTNNIYSLALAKDLLCEDDTLLFESDIIFEDAVLDALVKDERDTLALVDKYQHWMDGTCLKLTDDDSIEAFITKYNFRYDEKESYYKTVNIYKFSKWFSSTYYVPFLEAYQKALGVNEYYEQVLRVIAMLDDHHLKGKRLSGQKWYEIDDKQDLDIAESIFTEDDEKRFELINNRYGGFWRYAQLKDFCYLVNPYFPPPHMKEEIKANFDILMTQYPSGMQVNSFLAAKNFSVQPKNIVVGNGAAELIKSLLSLKKGYIGFVRPTFEEYPNRCDPEMAVNFIPDNPDFSYTADDLINFFDSRNIQCLTLINPDNPSGNYIPKADLMRLIEWSAEKGIGLIYDESFADFADEENNSLIDQKIIDSAPNLYVVKSISKSYGVPGLRLGVLVSGDLETIKYIKKDVSIWNINSFAEFYMQIEEKYRRDYQLALATFRKERKKFISKLSAVPGIRVIPSQANFVMAELSEDIPVEALQKELLRRYNILIKNLKAKTGGNYIRLAVRNREDNAFLIDALHCILKKT